MADKTIDDLTDLAAAPAGASFVPVWESGATKKVSVTNLLTNVAEVNDLTSVVTWANIPDANVPQSAVTQHQAALSITQSQISDLSAGLPLSAGSSNPLTGDLHLGVGNGLKVRGSYTDASNYEWLNLSADGAGTVTIAAETLGTGTDDVDIAITPAGEGSIILGASANNVYVDSDGNLHLRKSTANQWIEFPESFLGTYQHGIRWDSGGVGAGGMRMYSGGGWGVNAQRSIIFRNSGDNTALVVDNNGALNINGDKTINLLNGFGSYTDASNYEGFSLNSDGAGVITLAAETLGTGTDDVDIAITPAGTGHLQYGTHSAIGAETVTGYIEIKDAGGTVRKVAIVS